MPQLMRRACLSCVVLSVLLVGCGGTHTDGPLLTYPYQTLTAQFLGLFLTGDTDRSLTFRYSCGFPGTYEQVQATVLFISSNGTSTGIATPATQTCDMPMLFGNGAFDLSRVKPGDTIQLGVTAQHITLQYEDGQGGWLQGSLLTLKMGNDTHLHTLVR